MLLRVAALLLVLVASCGEDKGGDTDATTGETSGSTTGSGTTDTPTSSSTTTGGASTSTSEPTSTSEATTGGASTSTSEPTSTSEATTGDPLQFERFTLRSAAGPCPPNADCDGFVELLASRVLRVEKFGDLGDPVTELEIDEDDFAGALAVFADPALAALLDAPDPLCNPPTDVFESMELVEAGQLHEATTTGCADPPLAAARMMVESLRDKYLP